MLLRLFAAFADRFPRFRRWAWQRWYQYLAGYDVESWSFMNYGYEPLDENDERLKLEATDESDRYCIQLYNHVARAVDLRDLNVLEVGSGRGGGASFVRRYLKPQTMTGIDFSARAVAACDRQHQVDGLMFRVGDAESLPFDDETFDAVINVESSHCYGSMAGFLRQVHRVLRPGGSFLFADFRPRDEIDALTSQLQESGLRITEEEVITPAVLRALDVDSERKCAMIGGHIRKWLSHTFQQFAGVKGTAVFRCFEDGTFVYKRYLLTKPT